MARGIKPTQPKAPAPVLPVALISLMYWLTCEKSSFTQVATNCSPTQNKVRIINCGITGELFVGVFSM